MPNKYEFLLFLYITLKNTILVGVKGMTNILFLDSSIWLAYNISLTIFYI